MKILIVEEDVPLANFLTHALAAEAYEVELRGRQESASLRDYELIVLDLSVAAEEGTRTIAAIRGQAPDILLMGLGTRRSNREVVEFLDAGGDDYLAKPFSYAELSACIRALRRRSQSRADVVLKIADLNLDRVRRRVERAGRAIELTTKEFSLLEYLMLNAGRRISRAEILKHVWKALPCPGSTNLVDVYIAYVRKKIDLDSAEKLIHTTRGIGYEISAPAHNPAFAEESDVSMSVAP
jgi:two-component system copper resistance phosphate regulon response regulator CusR